MDAFLRSARNQGITVHDNSWDADAVLIWSVLWHGRMVGNRAVYDHYRSQGRPVIIAEVGALRRGHTWKIALDNVNGLGFYGHKSDLDPDRPARLGLRVKPTKRRADHVLIACQNSRSLQLEGLIDHTHWIYDQVAAIRAYTDRPLVVRPHPRSPMSLSFPQPDVSIQIPRKVAHTYDDFDLDLSCHAVININSGPGILAPLSGTPVVVDRSSLAWPITVGIQDLESPPVRDVDQWLIEIAHTEYEIPEIAQGLWLKRLRSRL